MNWKEAKKLCPIGWVHGEKEAEMRELFEQDEGAFYGRLRNWKEETYKKELPYLERRLKNYELTVRSEKARENGKALAKCIFLESTKLPPKDLPSLTRSLWFGGFVPRSHIRRQLKDDFRSFPEKDFKSDQEFQRAVEKLEACKIIEIERHIIPFKRSRDEKGQESTFYRVIYSRELEEGWSPEPWEELTCRDILQRMRDVLVKEFLFWSGIDDTDPYRIFELDGGTFSKVRGHVEQRLIEIFGEELLEREREETAILGVQFGLVKTKKIDTS